MTVLKRNRKTSSFEVFHHWYNTRDEITKILEINFGYSVKMFEKRINLKSDSPLTQDQLIYYKNLEKEIEEFSAWFIPIQHNRIINYIEKVEENITLADKIIPKYKRELEQRRSYQDVAIGFCGNIKDQFQYTITMLPVDINKYVNATLMIDDEIELIKDWRRSDNKLEKAIV